MEDYWLILLIIDIIITECYKTVCNSIDALELVTDSNRNSFTLQIKCLIRFYNITLLKYCIRLITWVFGDRLTSKMITIYLKSFIVIVIINLEHWYNYTQTYYMTFKRGIAWRLGGLSVPLVFIGTLNCKGLDEGLNNYVEVENDR